MANGVTIEGLDEALRYCDSGAADEMLKACRKAMRAGTAQVKKRLKAQTPERWRHLLKTKAGISRQGNLTGSVGLYNGKQKQGHQNRSSQIDDWFKAYWANYGTLENRDPNHEFQQPVKKQGTAAASRRKNKGGQKAQNFFEKGTEGAASTFIQAFRESLTKQGYDIK